METKENMEIILNIKNLFISLNAKGDYESFKSGVTTTLSPSFSHILTQTNNTMDGYRGRIIDSYEKSPVYFVKLENKNDSVIVNLLKENVSFYNDKPQYSKSNEIIISKTFTKDDINYEKIEIDIASVIFNYIIKQNWYGETFDYDKLYIDYSDKIRYNLNNINSNRVFAKNNFTLKPNSVLDEDDFFYFKNKKKINIMKIKKKY